jgi:hypothetical protein
MIWGLVRQVRKALPVRPSTILIGVAMAPIMLVVNVVILRQAAPGGLGAAFLVLGSGFGVAWGFTAQLTKRETVVVAERSILHLVFWAVSFGFTQMLATFAEARWVAGGLLAMFFATGTTLGSHLNLLVRQVRMQRSIDAGSREGPGPKGTSVSV